MRRPWTGVTRRAITSGARPVPPPRVCTVRSRRQTRRTETRSPYLRTLTATLPSGTMPAGGPASSPRSSREGYLLQEIQLVQHLPGAEGHAGERIIGHRDGEIGLLAQELVQPPEQGAATREHDAFVHDVGGQLRRCPLQTRAH